MKKLLIKIIEIYQTYLSFDKGLLSVLALGRVCRYEVSCSEYTKETIKDFGVFNGILLGLKRIWSCR
ncbi:membrane protein insertion efficiency factor YidD [Patescibacteria group bacterium]|nr:membrane protein insertion efficiency factor YidD [Patescibacteria group bacterium]